MPTGTSRRQTIAVWIRESEDIGCDREEVGEKVVRRQTFERAGPMYAFAIHQRTQST
jgi:hypothetical protein